MTDINPVIRKQLARQYREWDASRSDGTTQVMYTCTHCKKRFNAKRIIMYRRPFWSRSREATRYEIICEMCMNKRQFVHVHREEFTRITP